ncbi:MAG: hypothetical protein PHI34_06580 [Acidobacteriota bacterium]|nr:hypothetical protein [Acidobacteriota bacterium]
MRLGALEDLARSEKDDKDKKENDPRPKEESQDVFMKIEGKRAEAAAAIPAVVHLAHKEMASDFFRASGRGAAGL